MVTYEQTVDLLSDTEHALVPTPGKFEGTTDERIAQALYSLSLDGMCDEQRGSVDEEGWYGLIGRFVIWEDSQGFFGYEHFDDEDAARLAFPTLGQ